MQQVFLELIVLWRRVKFTQAICHVLPIQRFFRSQTGRQAILRQRFFTPPQPAVGGAQIILAGRIARAGLCKSAQGFHGIFFSTELDLEIGERPPGLAKPRIKGQRRFKAVRGALCLTHLQISVAEIDPVFGGRGVLLNGAGNEVDRRLVIARLPGQYSQQMQRVGLLGLLLQHPPIKGFGLRQAPGSMMTDRLLKNLLKGLATF